jgi:hypothetical protein
VPTLACTCSWAGPRAGLNGITLAPLSLGLPEARGWAGRRSEPMRSGCGGLAGRCERRGLPWRLRPTPACGSS